MSCPECGAQEVVPLTLERFQDLRGAAKLCPECRCVFLIAHEAVAPEEAQQQITDWILRRQLIQDAVDRLMLHPGLRSHWGKPQAEPRVWRRDAVDTVERLIAALVPLLRCRGQHGR